MCCTPFKNTKIQTEQCFGMWCLFIFLYFWMVWLESKMVFCLRFTLSSLNLNVILSRLLYDVETQCKRAIITVFPAYKMGHFGNICLLSCMVKTEYKWYVKFRYSEKAKEMWKKSPNLLWRYKVISKRKKKWVTFSNFLSFSQYLNFTCEITLW